MPSIEVPKLYVGCGLTHAPQSFKDEVEATKEILGQDWDVMQFLGTTAGTESDVYEQDIIVNVGTCDAFVGIVDENSFGLGYETSRADARGIPVMLAAHTESKITRLALGIPFWLPNVVFVRYESMVDDVPGLVQEHLAPALAAPQQ